MAPLRTDPVVTGPVLSVDVGGTKTLRGVIHLDGSLSNEVTTPTRLGGDDFARVGMLTAQAVLAHRPAAVAIGVPEYVDQAGSVTSHEVLSWAEQPAVLVADSLAEAGMRPPPLVVDSDVRLGALGEAHFGAGRGAASFVYVSLGTGLSSAFVIDGQAWRGARGEAIGFGEFRAGEGTLESLVSGAGVAAGYQAATGLEVTGRDVAERARGGEALATDLLVRAGTAVGDAIADLAAVLDPQRIVLGGGWGTADTPLTRRAREQYDRRSGRRPGAGPLVLAALGHRSGLLGGAVAARRALAAHPAE
ncbi:MAG: ROK family protein [Arachnia sp.]